MVESDELPVRDLRYSSANLAVTSTDSDISDNSYAKNTVVILSCVHPDATLTYWKSGTHKINCSIYEGIAWYALLY